MSLKRRVQYQYQNFAYALRTITLPTWATGTRARLTLMLVGAIFTTGYIFKISSTAISGYDLNTLENKTAVLQDDIRKLETQVAGFQSLQSIQSRAQATNMVAVEKINFLTISGDSVAVAR